MHIIQGHMYLYEGKDYSKELSREDQEAFDQLLGLQKVLIEDLSQEGRALRNKANVRRFKKCGVPTFWMVGLIRHLQLVSMNSAHKKKYNSCSGNAIGECYEN